MKLEDIKKLALLARIDMPESEMIEMANDFDPILSYVSKVQKLSDESDIPEDYILTNIMRDDIATHKNGEYTKKIIDQMPDSENGFLKVKQIL